MSATAQGPRGIEKFYYDIKVKESAALTPAAIRKLQKGTPLEDYPLVGLVYAGLAGTAEKGADGLRFTARGSKQRYGLKSNPALDALLAAGKTKVVLGGKVTQGDQGDPQIEVREAVESK